MNRYIYSNKKGISSAHSPKYSNYYPNVTMNQFISFSKKATIEAASIPSLGFMLIHRALAYRKGE